MSNINTRRLKELADEAGVVELARDPPLRASTAPAPVSTEANRAQAISLLAQRRVQKGGHKDAGKGIKGVFRSSTKKEQLNDPKNWQWSNEELDEALSAVIDNADTGLVAALLDLGANVNVIRPDNSTKDKNRTSTPVQRRSTVIKRAASLKRHGTLRLLVSRSADQTALDEGLEAALIARDTEAIEELLVRGANVNRHFNLFNTAISNGDEVIARLLLRSPRPLERPSLSAALQPALLRRSLPILSLLLTHGADPNYQNAWAFNKALELHEFELALALASLGQQPITPTFVTGDSFNWINTLPDSKTLKDFVEVLFCCGLQRNAVGVPQRLVQAIRNKWVEMVQLLVQYGVSVNFNGAEGLKIAIQNEDYHLASILLAGQISSENASTALHVLPKARASPDRTELIRNLINKGATGLPLGKWLVVAAEQNDNDLITLLVRNNAPLDTDNAKALKAAVSKRDLSKLRKLLDGRSAPGPASTVLPLVRQRFSASERLQATGLLLSAGATGPEVNDALLQAVADTSESLELIDELLRHNASVNHEGGRCLRLAVEQQNIKVLQLLCRASPSIGHVSSTLPFTLNPDGKQKEKSVQMIGLLLNSGATGEPLARTLILAVDGGIQNLGIINTLVKQGANANYDNVSALIRSIDLHEDLVLKAILESPTLEQTSVDRALRVAIRPNNFEPHRARMILRKSSNRNALNTILLAEAGSRKARLPVIEVALEFGADVNFQQGQALVSAVLQENKGLAKLLLQNDLSPDSKERAFLASLSFENISNKLELMESILGAGVLQSQLDQALIAEALKSAGSGELGAVTLLGRFGASSNFQEGEALQVAVTAPDAALLKVLVGAGPTGPALTKAFRTLSRSRSNALTSEIVQTARILLETCNIEQPAIDAALRGTLDTDSPHWNRYSEEMVDLLLNNKANVNTADGTCFAFAARRKHGGLLNKLLDYGPNFATIFPCLINSGLTEPALVETLELCFKHAHAPTSMNVIRRTELPILFTAMQQYPDGENVVEFLLNHGCNADAIRPHALDPVAGQESITALLWSLDPQNGISSPVVLSLLKHGASPTFQAARSGLTPIALAAREGREEVVVDLIRRNVDTSVIDTLDRTPLFYACGNPTAGIVSRLVLENVPKNEGSLHEAASNLLVDHVILLLGHGHNPEFPSPHHGGRSALGEVCMNANDILSPEGRNRLRKMIRLLLDHKSNPKLCVRGKSPVFLALDNATDPYTVTKALLDTELYTILNDPENIYHDKASGLCYSPISYVEHNRSAAGSQAQKDDLIRLLENKRCIPRYYSYAGEQPADAIGMPEAQKRRFDIDLEHQLILRRAREAEDQAVQLQQARHSLSIQQQRELDQERHTALTEQYSIQAQMEQTAHTLKLQRLEETEQVQRRADTQRHQLLIQQEQNQAVVRRQITDNQYSADLEHGRNLIMQQQTALEARLNAEQRALLEREAVDKRVHERRISLLRENERVQQRLATQRNPAIGWVDPD